MKKELQNSQQPVGTQHNNINLKRPQILKGSLFSYFWGILYLRMFT